MPGSRPGKSLRRLGESFRIGITWRCGGPMFGFVSGDCGDVALKPIGVWLELIENIRIVQHWLRVISVNRQVEVLAGSSRNMNTPARPRANVEQCPPSRQMHVKPGGNSIHCIVASSPACLCKY